MVAPDSPEGAVEPPQSTGEQTQRERDRPLSFHWKAAPGWMKDLDLPTARSPRHQLARESILLEAVLAEVGGWPATSYSRRRAFYTDGRRYRGTAFTYDTVVPSVDELARLGLVSNHIAPAGRNVGRQSTFRATSALLGAVPADLVGTAEHVMHELVRLRDLDKRYVDYRDTERTLRMRRTLAELNEGLRELSIRISGGPDVSPDGVIRISGECVLFPAKQGLYRVFNGDFVRGGRMYGGWWQQVPRELRKRLLIDGEATVEDDYPQQHPRLLYALAELPLEGDAYSLAGWPRKLCKIAFNVLLNASNYRAAVGAIAHEIDGEAPRQVAVRLLREMKARHAPIARHFHSGVGLLLQRVDADIAEAVLMRLLRRGIHALPIHDSFIVPARHRGELGEAMDAAFSDAVAGVRSFGRFRKPEQHVKNIPFHIMGESGGSPPSPDRARVASPELVPSGPAAVSSSADRARLLADTRRLRGDPIEDAA